MFFLSSVMTLEDICPLSPQDGPPTLRLLLQLEARGRVVPAFFCRKVFASEESTWQY